MGEIDPSLEAKAIDRIVLRSGGALNSDHVRCVFAILRSFARKPSVAGIALPEGTNRFLVGAAGNDEIAILGLEVRISRADALNLLTWMTLVGGFDASELEQARNEALAGE
jgi:hypothetical protein